MKKEILLKENERIDDLERNGYRIIQNGKKFCFGMDAVLLSGFAVETLGKKDLSQEKAMDLGTGTGILPILLAAKTNIGHFTGLEIQAESADMAARSVSLNDLEDRIRIVNGDLRTADACFPKSEYAAVTCNPPYMIGQHGITNPNDAKAIARHEILCTFEDVCRVSRALLKPGAGLYLVHRPFRLPELIRTLSEYDLEPKRMQLVYPYADAEPNMVLLEAIRGAKPRLTVEKPLIIFKAGGEYTEEIKTVYGY